MNQYVNDFNETTLLYYHELKKYKPITRARERKLLKRCKKGNLKAKNEIIESNLRFVFDIAKRYTGRGVPILDLVSEGNMGLLKAIDKFDESKNVKFITYAVWWIRQAMLEAIHKNKLINFIETEQDPSSTNCLKADKYYDYDENEDDNDSVEEEYDNRAYESNEYKAKLVSKLMGKLSDKERDIVESYYGIDGKKEKTLNEIGKKYGLTSERIRQIKEKTMKKLRTEIMLDSNFEEIQF